MALLIAGVLAMIAGIWLIVGTGSVIPPALLAIVAGVLLMVDAVYQRRRHHQGQ